MAIVVQIRTMLTVSGFSSIVHDTVFGSLGNSVVQVTTAWCAAECLLLSTSLNAARDRAIDGRHRTDFPTYCQGHEAGRCI